MSDDHWHVCGKCLFIWRHDPPAVCDRETAHKCPKCEAGPYYRRYDEYRGAMRDIRRNVTSKRGSESIMARAPKSKSEAKRLAVQKEPSLAAKVDQYYQTRVDRLALQKDVDALQKVETDLKNWLIDNIPKSEATGIAGKLARVSIVRKEKPAAEDWAAVYKHIQETGEFELMQRRISETAVRERWEDGIEVPGVAHFPYVDISLSKV